MMLRDGSVFARAWGAPNGLTVLCWHGAGGSSADFENVGAGLADRLGVQVVAIDGPGHGRSPSPPAETFRPSALAALAKEILDGLGLERCVFLGFSWGGTVGCWAAALYPERVLGLALVEGGHVDFADVPGFRTDRTLDELVSEAEAVGDAEGDAFGSHTPAVAGAMLHGLCLEPAAAAYSRLAASKTPVLFVGPQRQSSLPVARLARLVPQTEVVHLDCPSHELLRDAPDGVARLVGDWLASLQRGA